ncbi:hypothetical protein SNEBB_005654 [Seison nebaliae]|nr:hypothetical protein SNEBB_005654 [Seison nebaliae]
MVSPISTLLLGRRSGNQVADIDVVPTPSRIRSAQIRKNQDIKWKLNRSITSSCQVADGSKISQVVIEIGCVNYFKLFILKYVKYVRKYLITDADSILQGKMKNNSFYPFIEIAPFVYQLTWRETKHFIYYINWILFLVIILWIIPYYFVSYAHSSWRRDFFTVTGTFTTVSFVGIICILLILIYPKSHRLILYPATERAQFFISNDEFREMHIHNVYIRLAIVETFHRIHYRLMVGSPSVEEYPISKQSVTPRILRLCGMIISSNIGINFFDYDKAQNVIKWTCNTLDRNIERKRFGILPAMTEPLPEELVEVCRNVKKGEEYDSNRILRRPPIIGVLPRDRLSRFDRTIQWLQILRKRVE